MTWMDFTLGWEVILQRKAADRDVPATSREGAGDLVIRWRAHRVAWIEELCTAGGGVDLGGGLVPVPLQPAGAPPPSHPRWGGAPRLQDAGAPGAAASVRPRARPLP